MLALNLQGIHGFINTYTGIQSCLVDHCTKSIGCKITAQNEQKESASNVSMLKSL